MSDLLEKVESEVRRTCGGDMPEHWWVETKARQYTETWYTQTVTITFPVRYSAGDDS